MRRLVVLLALIWPGLAAADCAEMWFLRNLVFDRAGYCFGSTLGASVFDNGDCRTKNPALGRDASAYVARIKTMEAEFQCRIDTSRSRIDLPLMGMYRALDDLPLRDMGESGCIGWMGNPVKLRAGAGGGSRVIFTIRPGDDLIFKHEDLGGWSFINVNRGNRPAGIGWARFDWTTQPPCRMFAG